MKSPGFWFFVGDWMKDAELRFCSIFARGLLVDLLCLMFESKVQGFLCWPDGSPRSDAEIADAISGSTREEKLAGIAELERKGVLSRDEKGVLYSRRLSRLANLSNIRKQNGSKGGLKSQAKQKQTAEQNTEQTIEQTVKQKRGVTDSDSDSDTINKPPLSPKGKVKFEAIDFPIPANLDTDDFREAWIRWCTHRKELRKRITPLSCKKQLDHLASLGPKNAVLAIETAIRNGWQGIHSGSQGRAKTGVTEELPF